MLSLMLWQGWFLSAHDLLPLSCCNVLIQSLTLTMLSFSKGDQMALSPNIILFIKTLIFSSVVFVWVVRYQNIIEEFKQFSYPSWLRDIVGIFKIAFVILIMNSENELVKIGSVGISVLMIAALITHLRVKNPVFKMMPSFSLLILNVLIFTQS